MAFFASDADARFGYVPPGWHQHITLTRAKEGEWESQYSFAALMVPQDASDARYLESIPHSYAPPVALRPTISGKLAVADVDGNTLQATSTNSHIRITIRKNRLTHAIDRINTRVRGADAPVVKPSILEDADAEVWM